MPSLQGMASLKTSYPVNEAFRKFFLSYSQAINKQNNRHGSLFEKNFKRILIKNENHLFRLVYYIHNNPVHHDFV